MAKQKKEEVSKAERARREAIVARYEKQNPVKFAEKAARLEQWINEA